MIHVQKGFTLVELLVVIAILGVLAGTVTVAVVKHLDNAKVKAAAIDIQNYISALKTYYLHVGSYPSGSDGLQALIAEPASVTAQGKWKGPYLDDAMISKDPWGNDYVYQSPGADGREYEIISYGKDGEQGGEGLNADITSSNYKEFAR
jgi:general secretion pathway protein G